MTRAASIVKVGGAEYRVTHVHSYAANGPSGFGKFSFFLCPIDAWRRGEQAPTVKAYGGRVAWNSKLTPVSPADVERLAAR